MVTQEELKRLFYYDPDTGIFTRLVRASQNTRIGDVAGCRSTKKHSGKSYLEFSINNKIYKAHRLVFLYVNGYLPDNKVDHINGNGCDNRLENLRIVDSSENQKNQKKPSHNTSGVVGVCWHKQLNKWAASIQVMRKKISLGCYLDFGDAVLARKNAEVKYGFHKNHGTERGL